MQFFGVQPPKTNGWNLQNAHLEKEKHGPKPKPWIFWVPAVSFRGVYPQKMPALRKINPGQLLFKSLLGGILGELMQIDQYSLWIQVAARSALRVQFGG